MTQVFERIKSKLQLSRLILLFSFFSIGINSTSYGQHQLVLDSLMEINSEKLTIHERSKLSYSRSWYSFYLGKYAEACDHAKKAFELSITNELDTLIGKSSLLLGSAYINRHEYDSAIYYLQQGYGFLDERRPEKFTQEKTRLNIVLGDALANQLRYSEAIEVHEKNLITSYELNDTAAIVISLLSQARLYKDVGLYSTSLSLLVECEPFVSVAPYNSQKSSLFELSASVYAKMKDYPKAIHQYELAIKTENQVPDKKEINIGDYFFNMSETYFDMGLYDSALFVLDKAKRIFQKSNATYRSNAAVIREAKILVEINKYPDALRQLSLLSNVHPSLKPEYYITYALALNSDGTEKAIVYADSSRIYASQERDLFALKFAYEILSDLHAKERNWEKAYHFKHDLETMTDSLFKLDEMRAVQKIEINKIYAEKNAVIDNQGRQIEQERSSKEQLKFILLAVAALTVILVLIFLLRTKAQRTSLIEAENDRLRIEREAEQLKREMQNYSVNGLKHLKFLERLSDKLGHLKDQEVSKTEIIDLIVTIKQFLLKSQKEEAYNDKINLIENSFFEKIEKSAKLSNTEKKLCTFLKLEMSSKEISDFLHVSEKTVEVYRSRLRKKLSIPPELNFKDFFADL